MSTPSKIFLKELTTSQLFLKESRLSSILGSTRRTSVLSLHPLELSSILTFKPPTTTVTLTGLWQPGSGEFLPNALICINAEPLLTLTGENLVYV